MGVTIEWKPGDVATSRYGAAMVVKYHRAGCKDGHKNYPLHVHFANGDWGTTTELRPLVVIDPEDREQVERLVRLFDHEVDGRPFEVAVLPRDIDDMQAALREFANPTPPKPDEPTGLGAVVEDEHGALWVRVGVTIGDLHWRSTEPGNTNCFKWRAINAVRVLSEGVQS